MDEPELETTRPGLVVLNSTVRLFETCKLVVVALVEVEFTIVKLVIVDVAAFEKIPPVKVESPVAVSAFVVSKVETFRFVVVAFVVVEFTIVKFIIVELPVSKIPSAVVRGVR